MDPVLEYMATFSPQVEKVANYLRTQGFDDIRVHGGAGDDGVDIMPDEQAVRQCPCNASGTPKKVGIARHPVVEWRPADRRCQRAVFVTSSSFTEPAWDARIGHRAH